jgi:hypothetical protein
MLMGTLGCPSVRTVNLSLGCVWGQGHGNSQGSFEYLVFFNVFTAIAAECGLQPVADYEDPEMDELFRPEDRWIWGLGPLNPKQIGHLSLGWTGAPNP